MPSYEQLAKADSSRASMAATTNRGDEELAANR